MTSVNFAQPDVTLILDWEGVIQKAALSSAFSSEGIDGWLGLHWAETVATVETESVGRMIEDARTTGVSSFHEVTQRFPSGLELAVEYTTFRLKSPAGLIAIGRYLRVVQELRSDLIAAQKAMEQHYWKLREVETRHQLLFDTSNEPVVLIGADGMRIVASNPAAARALGFPHGRELLPELPLPERAQFEAMLRRVREQGNAPGLVVHLGPGRQRWLVRASLDVSEPDAIFVLRLGPAASALPQRRSHPISAAELFERLSDGFVVIDQDGLILHANRPFRDLVQTAAEDALVGEPLGRWLTQPGADMEVLLAHLRRDGAIRLFATTIQNGSGNPVEVEISAAGNLAAPPKFIGVMVSRRGLAAGERAPMAKPGRTIEPLDKASMRRLVQSAVADFERQCIDAASRDVAGDGTESEGSVEPGRKNTHSKLH